MKYNLEFSFTYDARLLGPETSERNPELIFWSSASEGWYQRIPVQWKNEDKLESVKQSVTVPVDDITSLAFDDTLRVLVLVETKNHKNRWCKIKAGTAAFFLKSVFEARDGSAFEHLTMPTVWLENNTLLKKGGMTLSVKKRPTNAHFQPPTQFAPIKANQAFLEAIIENIGVKLMAPLNPLVGAEVGLESGIEPSDPTVEGLHAPYYISEAAIFPGDLFWVNHTNAKPDEPFMVNLLEINLKRHRITREHIEQTVEKQFAEKGNKLSQDFHDLCVFLTNMVCTLSTALPYVGVG